MIPDGELHDMFNSQRMNGRKITREIGFICIVVPLLLTVIILLVL